MWTYAGVLPSFFFPRLSFLPLAAPRRLYGNLPYGSRREQPCWDTHMGHVSGQYPEVNQRRLRYMHKNFNVVLLLPDFCLNTLLVRSKVCFA